MNATCRTLCILLSATPLQCTRVGDGPEGRVAVQVSPLSLPGIVDATYTVRVTNGSSGTGDTLWTRTLTSTGFGDGAGALSYVGPCDASTGINSVTVTLESLVDASGVVPTADYPNPTPVHLDATCTEGRDTAVRFDITLARRASQGFFDVAVQLQDIFCSAKLDCVRPGTDEPLDLLHAPDGARGQTAVLGFACTASPTGDTYLYLDDVTITCTGLAEPVVVGVGTPGNVDLTAAPSANPGGYLFAAAVYRGAEGLADKAYWNVALGLDSGAFATAGDCALTARGTASTDLFTQTTSGFELPIGSLYPVVRWDVALSDAAERVCATHELDGGTGVATVYLGDLSGQTSPPPLGNGYSRATGESPADIFPPSVSAAATPTSGGTLEQGDPVIVELTFDEPVVVSGEPTVAASIGRGDVALSYVSGSGTDTLVFARDVQPGDQADDELITIAGTLDLSDGDVTDLAGNPVDPSFDPLSVASVTIVCVPPTETLVWAAPGVYDWQVPCGIDEIAIEAWGGGTGGSGGGGGGGGGGSMGDESGALGHSGGWPGQGTDTRVRNLDGATPYVLASKAAGLYCGGAAGGGGKLGYSDGLDCTGGAGGGGGVNDCLPGDPAGNGGGDGFDGDCGGFGGVGGSGGPLVVGPTGPESVLAPTFTAGDAGWSGRGGVGGEGAPGSGHYNGGGGGGGGASGQPGRVGEYEYHPLGSTQSAVSPFDHLTITVGVGGVAGLGGMGGAAGGAVAGSGGWGSDGTAGGDGAVVIAY